MSYENIIPFDKSKTKEYEKIELDSFQKSSLNALWSQIPSIVETSVLSNAYMVKFPDGLDGTLMRLSDGGNASPILSNGKIVSHASFHKIDSELVFASGMFSILSMATAQYYLKSINDELSFIDKKIDSILSFLYNDKKAELIANNNFLQYAYENYKSIMKNENQRIATITNLQNTKIVALKNIEFYINDLDLKTSSTVKNIKDCISVNDDASNINECLDLSMMIYVISTILEFYYSQNFEESYINYIKQEISKNIKRCENRIILSYGKLHSSINNIKALKSESKLELLNNLNSIISVYNLGEESKLKKLFESSIIDFNKTSFCITDDMDLYVKTS